LLFLCSFLSERNPTRSNQIAKYEVNVKKHKTYVVQQGLPHLDLGSCLGSGLVQASLRVRALLIRLLLGWLHQLHGLESHWALAVPGHLWKHPWGQHPWPIGWHAENDPHQWLKHPQSNQQAKQILQHDIGQVLV
jgi:hypothetical protein